MPHARRFGICVVALALAPAGCASRPSPAADHFRGASSVKAAGLGYYRSASHPDRALRFACPSSGGGAQMEYTVTGVATGPGAVAASVERNRSAWIVALKETGDTYPFARYRVLRQANGYCVDRALSD